MRRVKEAVVVLGVVLLRATAAGADVPATQAPAPASAPAPAPASAPAPAPASAPAPSAARAGLAVVALSGAGDAAWPLARSIYADPSLRPGSLDEPHARVLCGEPPAASATADLRDLSETVAALRGDDAPSRALLDAIALRFTVRAVVVVRAEADHPTARLYLPETGAFDAATYAPDDPPTGPPPSWSSTTRSLGRLFGAPAAAPAPAQASVGAPVLAMREIPRKEAPSPARPFYESVWFWGAVGAAALLGGAAYIATRDSSPSTIHLEVQVPH
jgi:hypothetical protein